MKILHLITGLEIGGAEMMLLKTLPKMGADFEHVVCCLKSRGPIGDRLEDGGITVHYLEMKHGVDRQAILKFKKLVKEFQPDLLVTYLIHADLFGRVWGRLFGVKKILCSVRVKLIQKKYLPFLLLDGLTSPLVTHYHFNSKETANMYRRFFLLPKKKITIIPNGLKSEKYTLNIDTLINKQSLGIAPEKIILGCVAKLRKQKGHAYLITAVAEALKREPRILLLLVGEGQERKNIESQVQKLGIESNVILLGDRTDIPELLQIMDVFVFPSLFEGMSNALMETMAAGKPIIATDIPENRELLTPDVTGVLAAPKDPAAFASAIIELLHDKTKCEQLGKQAQQTIREKYSLSTTVAKLTQLFLTVAKK